jgi:hypothetical protein
MEIIMVETMKACPFTGREPTEPIQQGNGQWRIWAGDYYLQRPTRDLVIAAWNRRSTPAHPAGGAGDIVEQSNAGQARGSATALDRKTQGVTAGETAPIVDRLRKYRGGDTQFRHLMDEAADLIQSLQSRLSISEENVERVAKTLWSGLDLNGHTLDGVRRVASACIASLGEE